MNYKLPSQNRCKTKPNLVFGFTLVETLVAISVLSISILGTFTAVQKGLATSTFAKDQVTAFYLIQEAMEYVKNVRDTNGIASLNSQAAGGAGVGWLTNIPLTCTSANVCRIDSNASPAFNNCGGANSNCPYINQDSATGFYSYTIGTATKFKRSIYIEEIVANREAIVTVSVIWTSGVFSKNITVKQSLFNTH